MHPREIKPGIEAICNVHWERRLFDALIPLPEGTSYNAYLIRGTKATALIDSGDPVFRDEFLRQFEDVPAIDYVVSQHSEQDHSGLIPAVLQRFPDAKLVCNDKASNLLITHLAVPAERIQIVSDGEQLSLGNKTLQFIFTPWVHWPETMCTYIPEDKCLFSCDLFGSHLATSDLFVRDPAQVYEGAKRYFGEIMMPFRSVIVRNLEKLAAYDFNMIAPSHGPVYDQPEFILEAYRDWTSPKVRNTVVLPYISMHGSTEMMVKHLTDALVARGVSVQPFDLTVTDVGKLAMALVDAATLIVGTPTVQIGPHPAVHYAAYLANYLKPKVKYAAVIGSFGWASKAIDQIVALIPNLKVEILGTILQKGLPDAETLLKLDALAESVALKHRDDPDVLKD